MMDILDVDAISAYRACVFIKMPWFLFSKFCAAYFKGTMPHDFWSVGFFASNRFFWFHKRYSVMILIFAKYLQRYSTKCLLSGVWFTAEWWLSSVSYTMEWILGGVSYIPDPQRLILQTFCILHFCILHCWMANWWCILHCGMATRRCILCILPCWINA